MDYYVRIADFDTSNDPKMSSCMSLLFGDIHSFLLILCLALISEPSCLNVRTL